ncbi:hypothetical protein NDA13_000476 [Ustilago tritici]|nr:hypothetical protein NDA13_000476 [Ustilago tritici]
MAAAACKTCTKCLQSFPLNHFLGHCNCTCRNCASCQGEPTDGLTAPFSPLPSSLPLPASTLSLAKPSALASAPTTAATAAASAPSCPTPPLPPTVFLTKDSPAFCGLQQQLDNQASILSNIATSLQQLLALLRNPEPRLPQPPSSQPVAATLASAMLPAANTAGSALGAPLPGESDVDHIFSWLLREAIQQVIDDALPLQDLGRLCNPDLLPVNVKHKHAVLVNGVLIKSVPSAASTSSTHHFTKPIPNVHCFAKTWTVYTCIRACTTNDPNLGAGLGAFLLHIIQTNHIHMWPSVASYVLTTCQQCFGHASTALWAQQDQAAWNQHLSTAASFHPPPKSATPGSANRQANTQPSGPPSKRQKGLKGSAQHIDGPTGPPNLSTPPLQGLARFVCDSVSMLNLGTPPLQGSAWCVVMPAGLGGTRTPPLQGLAQLFDLVPAAFDVPSADWCLSLLLNAWSHNPGPHPNTSFAGNVFDPASQPARHGSMQEHAFAWSTLLSLYPDPVYRCQLLGMTEHGCLLGYDGPLCNADHCSNNLSISSASHSHLCREIDARLAEGHLSIIPAGTNLIESPIGVVPKPRSTKLCTIHHLSHPRQPTAAALPSINAGISLGFIRLWYKGLQDLLAFVSQNPGCLLWKGDLEDAFRHIVTAKRNAHLLGFSYNGIHYCENALTFGGSSSPWLFNLVAKFLHWLVTACLSADWPVNHYLDGTFGIVPVSHATHTLLPIHILALAANALGLQLSPKKIFGASTKLEVLGLLFPRMHDALFSHLARTVALQVPHLALLPVLVSLLVPPTSCGTALLPAPAAVPGAHPCPSSPSASDISGLAHPVFWPQASNCWSGSPTSPALVTLSTQPSTGSVPSDPTMWTLASTPQVSPAAALRGYKHLHGIGHSGTKLPVTLPLLHQVLLAMEKMADLFPQDRLVLQAAFACFLHSGKLVWDRTTNRTTILTVSSVEWASDHVVLTLPTSKTDPFWQGVRVVAPEVGGIECPAAHLRHLSHGCPPLALLFGLGPSGLDPLPQSTFVTILCRTIQACSLPALQYTGRSFCHGAATWASQHGASTADIQSLSWWSSGCYCCYINRLAQERSALVTLALFSIRDCPLVPSGPAWRDPGLA